jgi:yecA family protein
MSQSESLITFEALDRILVPVGALNSPSELHGMLSGKLIGGQRLNDEEWLLEALSFLDIITSEEEGIIGDSEGKVKTELARLYSVTLAQVEDSSYSFQLLLPTDESQLADRTRSIGEWCHGFLSGFGSSGIAGGVTFSEESAEGLRDIAAIVGAESEENSEDDSVAEGNFVEITEYIRLVALNLFAEFGRSQQGNDVSPVVH